MICTRTRAELAFSISADKFICSETPTTTGRVPSSMAPQFPWCGPSALHTHTLDPENPDSNALLRREYWGKLASTREHNKHGDNSRALLASSRRLEDGGDGETD